MSRLTVIAIGTGNIGGIAVRCLNGELTLRSSACGPGQSTCSLTPVSSIPISLRAYVSPMTSTKSSPCSQTAAH